MTREAYKRVLHRLFEFSVFIKGVDGALETVGGILFLSVSRGALNSIIISLTAHELSGDPNDWVAASLRNAVRNLSSDTKLFAGVYLLAHGVSKILLVVGLLRSKFWAYPTALCFLGAFIFYEAYRFTHTHSLALLSFALFDSFVAYLVWQEYLLREPHRGSSDT